VNKPSLFLKKELIKKTVKNITNLEKIVSK